jgi:hypothetical protein
MAKVLLGPMVGQASGGVGGLVFSHGRYGYYIRARVKPTVSVTEYALLAKETLSYVSQAWQDLDGPGREAWRIWAANNPVTDRLGQRQVLAGNAAFVKINALRMRVIGALLTTPPVGDPPTPLTSITLTADIGEGEIAIAFGASPLAASERLVYEAAVTNGLSQSYVESKLRYCGCSSPAQTTPYNGCDTEIPARFGSLQVGQLLSVRAYVYDGTSGLWSLPLADSVLVTST